MGKEDLNNKARVGVEALNNKENRKSENVKRNQVPRVEFDHEHIADIMARTAKILRLLLTEDIKQTAQLQDVIYTLNGEKIARINRMKSAVGLLDRSAQESYARTIETIEAILSFADSTDLNRVLSVEDGMRRVYTTHGNFRTQQLEDGLYRLYLVFSQGNPFGLQVVLDSMSRNHFKGVDHDKKERLHRFLLNTNRGRVQAILDTLEAYALSLHD